MVNVVALGTMCPSTAVSPAIIFPPLPYSSCPFYSFQENKPAKPWNFQTKYRKVKYFHSVFFLLLLTVIYYDKQVKLSRYRPGVAQRVGRGIALLLHNRGTRRW